MQRNQSGINVHVPTDPRQFRLCQELGVGWARVDVNWNGIELAKNQCQWAVLDAAVDQLSAAGLQLYATVAYTPRWANGDLDHTVPPRDGRDYADFVGRAAQRYQGRVAAWGLWNEPNLPAYFTGSVEDYLDRILVPGADAVHDAGAGALVAGPELSHAGNVRDATFWYRWLRTILTQAGPKLDVITHHLYADPTAWELWRRLDGFVVPYLEGRNLRDALREGGVADKPFWLTEIGWKSSVDGAQHQADNYGRFLDGLQTREWVAKVFFYELNDVAGFPDQWGVVAADFTPKPAYQVLQTRVGSA